MSRRFTRAEQDMRSPANPGMWEPALDALGGKRNDSEDCATAACREVEEESGGLVCGEHLRRLDAWIAAQQLDSPNVYHDQDGKAVFFYYPIPHDMKKFWFVLNETFARKMSGQQLDQLIAAHRRLTHPEEMGNLFKVLGLYPENGTPPPGLTA